MNNKKLNKTLDKVLFDKVALIGVGMIGGSFILALKEAGIINHITGIDTCDECLDKALELKIIDEKSTVKSLKEVDLIIIATPVGAISSIFVKLKNKSFIKNVTITDVGSTKQSIIKSAEKELGFLPANFVPSHPIAGKEYIGIEYAEKDMFNNYKAIITPHKNTCPQALEKIKKLWEACGSTVNIMQADVHDRILAATSHLPHILAYSLVNSLTNSSSEITKEEIFKFTAGGFKSLTRTASSNPIMWRDICLNNKDEILHWLDNYQENLLNIRNLIANEDANELKNIFENAKNIRDYYLKD